MVNGAAKQAKKWITDVAGVRADGRPPGPNLVQLGRLTAQYATDLHPLLGVIANRYGDIVDIPVPMPRTTITLVSHPDHIDHVMVRHPHRYHRFALIREMVLGELDVMPPMEGDEWKRWRKPLSPFFGEHALAGMSPKLSSAIAEGVNSWDRHAGRPGWLDLEHELGTVVLDAVMRALFSTTLDPDDLRRYVISARTLGGYAFRRALMLRVPNFVPRPLQRRGEDALNSIMGQTDELIAQRTAAGPCAPPDLLDALIDMSSSFGGGPEMQYRRLRTEVSNMVFAAFETTAESVAWAIAMLWANPTARARAYAEVDELGGAPIEYSQLQRLPYLRAVVEETLRIQAPPAIVRTAEEDDEIGGCLIPKGSHILVSPYGIHRDRRFWNDPERFEPDRFLSEKINRKAFIPFNTGQRKCMGWRMAYIDAILTLAAILQRYTFTVEPSWTPRAKMRVSTGLVDGLPVRLRKR